jgi:hypothetical protein
MEKPCTISLGNLVKILAIGKDSLRRLRRGLILGDRNLFKPTAPGVAHLNLKRFNKSAKIRPLRHQKNGGGRFAPRFLTTLLLCDCKFVIFKTFQVLFETFQTSREANVINF